MLEEGIIDGALVTVMDEENPLKPKVIIARSKKEIISASGSKYCPVPLNAALKRVLKLNGLFAVVALPCHIHGIRKMEILNPEIRKKIRYLFGLFCANTVTFLGTYYFLRKYNIRNDSILELRYRDEGWPGMITIRTRNGVKYKIPRGPGVKNILYKALYSSAFHYDFIPYRCLLCPDQTNELSDISFGDAWHPMLLKSSSSGYSIIIARTKEAEKLLRLAFNKGVIRLIRISESTLLKSQNFYFKEKVGSRIYILNMLNKPLPYFKKRGLKTKFNVIDLLYFLSYFPSFFSKDKRIWIFLPLIALFRECLMVLFRIAQHVRRRLK